MIMISGVPNPYGNPKCCFEYLATKVQPCWGQIVYGTEADNVEHFTCQAHVSCSSYIGTSDIENMGRYNTKP